ncbi:uncharacterized protein [Euwallacea fornicatus]|uniref:uncharacterized protein n=1 Tax=Euwallacea fornicatus TaxID=995702 RepID=UPI00338E1CE5
MSNRVSRLSPFIFPENVKQNSKKLECDNEDPLELKLLVLSFNHKNIARFLQIILVALNIIVFVFCIIGKSILYNESDHFNNEVVLFINGLSDFLLMVVNIMAVVFFAGSPFLLEIFSFISKRTYSVKRERKTFARFIKILRVAPILPLCLNLYFFGFGIGWTVYKYFLARDVWYYILNLMICSFSCLINKLNYHYVALNDHLEELSNSCPVVPDQKLCYLLGEINYPRLYQSARNVFDTGKFSKMVSHYNYLCNMLDKFNNYIKTYLVLVLMCLIINILYNCTVLIQYGAKPRVINGIHTNMYVFFVETMMAINSFGQAALGAMIGEHIQEEGERTTSTCFTMLMKLNHKNVKTEAEQRIVNELNFLLDLSKSRKISIHAGGFFELNWGILGSITSTAATYSIVIIQFLLK